MLQSILKENKILTKIINISNLQLLQNLFVYMILFFKQIKFIFVKKKINTTLLNLTLRLKSAINFLLKIFGKVKIITYQYIFYNINRI